MISKLFLVLLLIAPVGCISRVETPTPARPPTLPVATGIPVTPTPNATAAALAAAPTATVETLATPTDVAEMFGEAGDLLKAYQPPDTGPQPLYAALARGIGEFMQ